MELVVWSAVIISFRLFGSLFEITLINGAENGDHFKKIKHFFISKELFHLVTANPTTSLTHSLLSLLFHNVISGCLLSAEIHAALMIPPQQLLANSVFETEKETADMHFIFQNENEHITLSCEFLKHLKNRSEF